MARGLGFLFAMLASAMPGSVALSANLPRIVSMNACSDQLLLALADPAQILAVSPFVYLSWRSRMTDRELRYPMLKGGAEEVLMLKPDIVVASEFDKDTTRELSKATGLRLAEFAVRHSLDEVKDQFREMGELVQHPDRARAEIARLDAAITRARQAATDKHYRVVSLSSRGFVAGRDSLIGSLLTETGLLNAAADLGPGQVGLASNEAIESLKPDFLLVSEAGGLEDGHSFALHRPLERFLPPEKRIVIPERLTVCGGVMLAEALDVLAAELKRVAQ